MTWRSGCLFSIFLCCVTLFLALQYRGQRDEVKHQSNQLWQQLSGHLDTARRFVSYQSWRGYILPASTVRTGKWSRIDPGWPGFSKTKALAVYNGMLCAGFLSEQPGTEVWCLDEKWERIGHWPNRSYVPFLVSFDGDLYAGVDSEVWRYRGGEWTKTGSVGQGCIAYSGHVHEGTLWVGSLRCGAALYRLHGDRLLHAGTIENRRYMGIYELHSHDGNLYIGAAASYGSGAVFRYGREFTKIGGDGVNGSWLDPGFMWPESFASFDGKLIVSMSNATRSPASPFWAWDGTEWKPLGPPPDGWAGMNNFNALLAFGECLLVSAGEIPGRRASVWAIGHSGFVPVSRFGALANAHAEYVYRMIEWRGMAVAGFGDGPGMAQIWAFSQ